MGQLSGDAIQIRPAAVQVGRHVPDGSGNCGGRRGIGFDPGRYLARRRHDGLKPRQRGAPRRPP